MSVLDNDEVIEALNHFDFLFGITLDKENAGLDHTSAEANRINRAYYFKCCGLFNLKHCFQYRTYFFNALHGDASFRA